MAPDHFENYTRPICVQIAKKAITYGVTAAASIIGYTQAPNDEVWIGGAAAFLGAALSWGLNQALDWYLVRRKMPRP